MTAKKKSRTADRAPDKKATGDERIWRARHRDALAAINEGNNYKARKMLQSIIEECPIQDMKEEAGKTLKTLSVDPWFYVIWGVTAAVLLAAFIYYVILK